MRSERSSARGRSPLRRERVPSSSPLRNERAPPRLSPQVPVRPPGAPPQPPQRPPPPPPERPPPPPPERPPPPRSPIVVERPLPNPPPGGAVGEEPSQGEENLRRIVREELAARAAMASPVAPPGEEIPFGELVASESQAHQEILEQLRPFYPQVKRVKNSVTQKYSFEYVFRYSDPEGF